VSLGIALFALGLFVFGAGLFLFEKYSPLNTTSKIMGQFWLGLLVMLGGAGLVFLGFIDWLVARICECGR